MAKKNNDKVRPRKITLNVFEFKYIMGDSWEHLDLILGNIFCDCPSEVKKLIDYKISLNDMNDIVLKGKCSFCMEPAARYIETGESEESFKIANKVRKNRESSK